MVKRFSAALIQSERRTVSHRDQIYETNLKRCLELVDYSVFRMGFNDHYAPTKLAVFPEVFMQGWYPNPEKYKSVNQKVARDIAIRIPGPETEIISQKARELGIFIAGTAHEVIPEISEDFGLNCGFIIDPKGDVILKYHKHHNYLVRSGRDDASPQDVWDKYIEVMDGTFGRKKGDLLSCFYPVVETEIGKLGYIICNDGYTFETFRACGVQGCEVLLRSSGMQEPEGTPPQDMWLSANKCAAWMNLMYVVAAAPGPLHAPRFPMNAYPGNSMIVGPHGEIVIHANYPGETVTYGVIDVEGLRHRRMDQKHHWVSQMRMDAFREIYNRDHYPKNLFLEKGALDYGERIDEQYKVIRKLVENGTYILPEGYKFPEE